jgi:hypothetical protein
MTKISLESLEVAVKIAAVQAEQLYLRHTEWQTIELVRLELNHIYELVHDEIRILRRAGEETS